MTPAESTRSLASTFLQENPFRARPRAGKGPAVRRRRLLGAMALAPLGALPGRSLAQPELPLTLAQEAGDDIHPRGWLVSEKFDGVRACWDGRVLRFRSGLAVAAPASFLATLPPFPLDGELWLGRGRFEDVSGIVRRAQPQESAWRDLRYLVFEMPGAGGRFEDRARMLHQRLPSTGPAGAGESGLTLRPGATIPGPSVLAVTQTECADRHSLQALLERVVAAAGEGLMLHHADAPEIHGRTRWLLKLKPQHDDEAVVVGYQAGRGQLSGRMGALRVRDDAGRQFELGTGFSEEQRRQPPALGTRVTFTHRGRTASGTPRFASFLRLASM